MRQIVQSQLNRVNSILDSATSRNDSFVGGQLGLLYYYYQIYKAEGNQDYRLKAEKMLENVFSNINSGYPRLVGTSFNAGGAGLGFVMNSLCREGLVSFNIEQEFAELDNYLFTNASYQIEDDFIDFLHGALGVLHYFTQRPSSVIVNGYLDELVGKLCARVNKKDVGYWFSNYVLNLEDKDNINFGLSHGQSGFLLILLNAYERSNHKSLIEKIVTEGIRFIRKYKMDVDFSNDEYSAFPFIVKQQANEITAPNRLGWCYGDLNEVLLFYRAGKLFKNEEMLVLADVIGAQTLMRKTEKATLVYDSSFCHGASGVSQLYRQLYKESNLPIYKTGYEYWMEQTLLFLDKDLEKGTFNGKEHELLDGLTGVALSLLSYVSDQELVWSKSLLL
jgi:lantibiotic modifying enzyme